MGGRFVPQWYTGRGSMLTMMKEGREQGHTKFAAQDVSVTGGKSWASFPTHEDFFGCVHNVPRAHCHECFATDMRYLRCAGTSCRAQRICAGSMSLLPKRLAFVYGLMSSGNRSPIQEPRTRGRCAAPS
eukprot:484274-Rhodomonas_salina.1